MEHIPPSAAAALALNFSVVSQGGTECGTARRQGHQSGRVLRLHRYELHYANRGLLD